MTSNFLKQYLQTQKFEKKKQNAQNLHEHLQIIVKYFKYLDYRQSPIYSH